MTAKKIIRLAIILSVLFTPTLFRHPSAKLWIPFFLLNGFVNHCFNKILVTTNKVKYPIRFKPKIFKINFVYDYLICPYLSVWYCQSTYNDNFSGILKKAVYWGFPQTIYEIWLERKTKALKFQKGWRWFHSLFLVFIVKFLSRGMLELMKRTYWYEYVFKSKNN
ncbi:hypothetical protein GH741_01325 [Aquibacillus halophilus]|uniref:Uncharacterized protein n=1 Tax=Aquibacillus halophilus TaxID=930132 RepID=A0A6A8DJ27_9BACI|nr:CBO0543 family protein [Aquibacillus halophilus]MRH41312.1 hypothetical protein [Aquibacillus halophilus]